MKIELTAADIEVIKCALALYGGYMTGEGNKPAEVKKSFTALEKLMSIKRG